MTQEAQKFKVIGMLGGGQLGQMTAMAAQNLGFKVHIVDPNPECAAHWVAHHHIVGAFTEAKSINELAKGHNGEIPDVITVEIEHVNCDVLDTLVKQGIKVLPTPDCIRTIQDKFRQKQHFEKVCGDEVPMVGFWEVPAGTRDEVIARAKEIAKKNLHMVTEHPGMGTLVNDVPFMLKAKKGAYDGRGNQQIHQLGDLDLIPADWFDGKELYIEEYFEYQCELAVNVMVGQDGIFAFPCVETYHSNNICTAVVAPARVPHEVAEKARQMALAAARSFDTYGVFGVEMFWNGETTDRCVVLNEIAPRPHNSGHYTIEACNMSQFEGHVRCITGLPLWTPQMVTPVSCMLNILGANLTETVGSDAQLTKQVVDTGNSVENCHVHWYGKPLDSAGKFRGRKLGHITACAKTYSELIDTVSRLHIHGGAIPSSMQRPPRQAYAGANEMEESVAIPSGFCPAEVGIIMGSDSDLPTMKAAAEILEGFGVSTEVKIVSAHRTPDKMFAYAKAAHLRGIKVIIAGAGGAAHLPGMVAAMTPLPVIGVPVRCDPLQGNDSLLSIVQMPRGVPVATVAIGNSTNAGLLAARILGASDSRIRAKMQEYMKSMEAEVEVKADKLDRIGFRAYLDGQS